MFLRKEALNAIRAETKNERNGRISQMKGPLKRVAAATYLTDGVTEDRYGEEPHESWWQS